MLCQYFTLLGNSLNRIAILTLALFAGFCLKASTVLVREAIPQSELGNVILRDAKTDIDGAAYVAGECNGPVRFNETISLGDQGHRGFVGKIDSKGQWLWVRYAEGFGENATVTCITIAQGWIYVGGYIGTDDGDGFSKPFPRGTLAKFNSDSGTQLWAKQFGTVQNHESGKSKIYSIAITSDQSVYIGGTFTEGFSLGNHAVYSAEFRDSALPPNNPINKANNWNLFLIKATADADGVWNMIAGSTYNQSAISRSLCAVTGITIDPSDNIYLSGTLQNRSLGEQSATVNDKIYVYNSTLTSYGSLYPRTPLQQIEFGDPQSSIAQQAFFIARASPNGEWDYFLPYGRNHRYRFHPASDGTETSNRNIFTAANDPQRFWASDIQFANGSLFVGGFMTWFSDGARPGNNDQSTNNFDVAAIAAGSTPKSGFIARFRADTGNYDGAAALAKDSSPGDALRKHAILKLARSRDGVLALGTYGTYVGIWSDLSQLSSPPVTNLISARTNFFVAGFDHRLSPKWLRTTTFPNEETPPERLVPSILTHDAITGRTWFGGAFGNSPRGRGHLVLGTPPVVGRYSFTGSGNQSFLAAVDAEGEYLEAVTLTLSSQHGPLSVNGVVQLGTNGGEVSLTFLRGTAVTSSIPTVVYDGAIGRFPFYERGLSGDSPAVQRLKVSDLQAPDSLVYEIAKGVSGFGRLMSATLSPSLVAMIERQLALFVTDEFEYEEFYGSTDEINAGLAKELSNHISTNHTLYLSLSAVIPAQEQSELSKKLLEESLAIKYPAFANNVLLRDVRRDGNRQTHHFASLVHTEANIESLTSTRWITGGFRNVTTGELSQAAVWRTELNDDLSLQADWSTEHLLEISNDIAGVRIGNDNLGNPVPAVGRHWIPEGQRQDAFVDGMVTDSDPSRFGSRYLAASYLAEGAARPTGSSEDSVLVGLSDSTLLSRLQVKQFLVTAPAKITYQWRKQYRVQVSTSIERAASLPFIQTEQGPGFHPAESGSGEFWFDAESYLQIGSRKTGSLRTLTGWRNGDGEFPSLEGGLFHPRLTHSTDGEDRYLLTVTNLGRPTRVMWDYDNQVFRKDVPIGGALDLAAVSGEAFEQSGVILQTNAPPGNKTIVDSPPGSTVEDMAEWDDVDNLLYPVRPGITKYEWATNDEENPVVVLMVAGFPGDPIPDAASGQFSDPNPDSRDSYRYRHLVGSPPVLLNPSDSDGRHFLGLEYSENGSLVSSGGAFTADRPGRSVLLFSDSSVSDVAARGDRTQETLRVRVVESRNWDRELHTRGSPSETATNRLTATWDVPWKDRLLSQVVSSGLVFSNPVALSPMPGEVESETVVIPADFDGDGVRDLLLLGLGQEVRLQRGGRFGEPPQILSSVAATRLDSAGVAGDLDGDGDLDLVRATSSGKAYVYLNRGGPEPFRDVEPEEFTVGIPPVAMQLIELSHPGRLDLLVANEGTVLRFEGRHPAESGPIFSPERSENLAEIIGVTGSVTAMTAGDQDGDGTTDLLVGEADGTLHLVHGLPGEELFKTEVQRVEAGGRIASLMFGNVLGTSTNQILAVVGAPEEEREIRVFEPKGSTLDLKTWTNGVTSRSFALLPPEASAPSPVVFGAAGGITQWSPDSGEALLLNPSGAQIGLGALGIGDLDGDGSPDLYLVEKSRPQVHVFTSGGSGPLAKGPVRAAVGSALQSPFDRSLLGQAYVIPGVKGNALFNARLHPAEGVTGPIIPVNQRFDTNRFDELVVAWYEVREGIEWPYQPVRYQPQWPQPPARSATEPGTLQRIVIASRLGSEGLGWGGRSQTVFDPEQWDEVAVYNQPDPAAPGYNPNEEHARVYPSLLGAAGRPPVPAAFALRDDLNVSRRLIQQPGRSLETTDYTSDPFVLVEHRNRTSGAYGMTVYAVEREDREVGDSRLLDLPGSVSTNYVFQYRMLAGERVTAPYPMNLVMGLLPCVNTVPNPFENGVIANGSVYTNGPLQRTYFVDHKGEGWAVSGDGLLYAQLFYRLQPDFWYPTELLVPRRGIGDCVPWIPSNHPVAVNRNRDGIVGAFALDTIDANYPTPIEFQTEWPTNVPTLKAGETLTFAGGEYQADHPEAPGLPGVVGWAAGQVVFDSLNPEMLTDETSASEFTAWIISPLEERLVSLPRTQLPAHFEPSEGHVTVVGTEYRFNELPPSLQKRLFYDPFRRLNANSEPGVLGLRGYLNDRTLGDSQLTAAPPPVYLLEPNVLTSYERDVLLGTSKDPVNKTDDSPYVSIGNSDNWGKWATAVAKLFVLSRNPQGLDLGESTDYLTGVQGPVKYDAKGDFIPDSNGRPSRYEDRAEPLHGLGPGLALIPSPRFLEPNTTLPSVSYVTLAENNDDSLDSAPVAIHIVKVVSTNLYRGAIKTIASDNVFDEKLTLRHTADFGGNVDQIAYSWWDREEDGQWRVYGPLPPDAMWSAYGPTNGLPALNQIDLQGANPLLLADNLFFVHYRHQDSPAESTNRWSDWAGAANSTSRTNSVGQPGFRPQLATGWVKRVFNRLTPYEARFNDFRNNPSPATYASLIQQAGPPPRGAVALNSDKNVIENAGLLEIYQTVIDRAKALSIDATQPTRKPGISAALMLGTTRISQIYKLLGDEAVSDAFDPTIGFGTSSTEYGKLAPTIFAFQNQVGTLLEEELALLRGLDEDRAWPVHNRLSWNFTRAEGEAAYAMNYGIRDVNNDGFINERDGQIQFPQGHGDAWGHYLSAIRPLYDLIANPNFNWQTRAEWFNQSDVVIPVDYLDERKFAEIAGARAAAGAEIVGLSLRSHYTEDPWGQWQGYRDGDSSRAWGTMEWARRAGQAALLDWVMANALLPSRDTNHPALGTVPETASGIERLDRSTVPEIARISAALGSIQSTYDTANGRLNPLGLDPDVVPFDLDPTFVDVGSTAQIGRPAVQGLTHFEQIYERAYAAVDNATAAFDYATEQQNQLRRVAEDVESNRKQAIAQDTEFRNRLIEIFGTPYRGTIGSGRPYPAGYEGPDLSLWMYVDVQGVSTDTVPAPSSSYSIPVTSFKADLVSLNEKFKNLAVEGHPRDFFGKAVTDWDANLVSWTNVQLTDNSVLELHMPATARGYTFQAPTDWGERAAPGRLQSLLSDMVQIEADLAYAVGDYDVLLNSVKWAMERLDAKIQLAKDEDELGRARLKHIRELNDQIQLYESLATGFSDLGDRTRAIADATAEGFPRVVGVDYDPFSPVVAAINTAAILLEVGFRSTASGLERAAAEEEFNKEESSIDTDLKIERLGFSYEIEEQLKEIHQMMINEGTTRIAVFRIQEQLRQKADEFRATLEEGLRLIEERQVLNQQLAAATQENRYADFLLRNSRNEALQKYRAAFDLASRYTFLATKAFDYETNFDPNDRLSPRPLLSQIVRERTLGQLLDGKPQHRGGLAGVLAGLYENFRVIEGQLGFNNPQLEFNRFSLRREKLGIRRVPDPESLDPETRLEDESEDHWKNRLMQEYKFTTLEEWSEAFERHESDWRTSLTTYLKTNLWEVPEFRRFCRPFAPRDTTEPGLVIPFGTEVVAGRNFFGNKLNPGDSAYDPSNFSTKIRSVRVNFVDYDSSELALTPRVYLVPAGLDGMYVPNQSDFKPVYWNVSDQRIPVPVQTGPSELTRPNWLPAIDTLGGPLGEIRRFSSFRAYLEDADPDVMTRDTRLVGRSVWNTQWLLIIPGRSLLWDPDTGLEKFMESVSDIALAFETYGNSGN